MQQLQLQEEWSSQSLDNDPEEWTYGPMFDNGGEVWAAHDESTSAPDDAEPNYFIPAAQAAEAAARGGLHGGFVYVYVRRPRAMAQPRP